MTSGRTSKGFQGPDFASQFPNDTGSTAFEISPKTENRIAYVYVLDGVRVAVEFR